ncbi:hypothetical protein [Mycobacteroides abscessus]|uniref:hypothetical protein n=1 Tax=Mycobacteroides abscessus TaxID=36809 RepID=UPI0012FFF159|nr:hypothetical protein [Mycobacteroides abscessus]
MKGFELGHDTQTGDIYLETAEGEYIQWIPGKSVDVIAVTADRHDALDLLLSIHGKHGLPFDPSSSVVIIRAQKPTFMSSIDAIDYVKSTIDSVDFFQVDGFGFSVTWASPERMEKIAPKFGGHGEASLMGAGLQSEVVLEILRMGTPSIRVNADQIGDLIVKSQSF